MEHLEKYYIEVNDEEIEVEVLWEVTLDKQSRRCGDGWESFTEPDFRIMYVTNLKTKEDYLHEYGPRKDWEHAFEKADANGKIQCYVQF